MDTETTLIEHEGARVALEQGSDGDALLILNAEGRARVRLSRDQGEALARAAPGEKAAREIERKFVVTRAPKDLDRYPHERLRQGYLVITETASFRIRDQGGKSRITCKRGTGLDRAEVELDVSPLQAGLLWPLAADRQIDKTRYLIPDDEGQLEVDVYDGALAGLVTLEREFSGPEGARSWVPPQWAALEVTEDPRMTNARLAIDGVPPDIPRAG